MTQPVGLVLSSIVVPLLNGVGWSVSTRCCLGLAWSSIGLSVGLQPTDTASDER